MHNPNTSDDNSDLDSDLDLPTSNGSQILNNTSFWTEYILVALRTVQIMSGHHPPYNITRAILKLYLNNAHIWKLLKGVEISILFLTTINYYTKHCMGVSSYIVSHIDLTVFYT